jgi:PAS domain S-box-containing protein
MTQGKDSRDRLSDLRRRAEAAFVNESGDVSDVSDLSPEDVQKLIHDLQVHQIELEMQNEELRQAQLALEESRDRYLDLYDYAPVGYFTLDENALVLEANLSGASLLGMDRGSLIGKPLTSFVHKETQDTFYFHRNQVLQTGTRHMCEIKLVKPDGSWFHAQLESVGIADPHGEFSRLRTISIRHHRAASSQRKHYEGLTMNLNAGSKNARPSCERRIRQLEHEIAERTKAEEALRESQQRLDLALSGAGLGSWDWNLQTRRAVFDNAGPRCSDSSRRKSSHMSVGGRALSIQRISLGLWRSCMHTWKAVRLCSRLNTGSGPSRGMAVDTDTRQGR